MIREIKSEAGNDADYRRYRLELAKRRPAAGILGGHTTFGEQEAAIACRSFLLIEERPRVQLNHFSSDLLMYCEHADLWLGPCVMGGRQANPLRTATVHHGRDSQRRRERLSERALGAAKRRVTS